MTLSFKRDFFVQMLNNKVIVYIINQINVFEIDLIVNRLRQRKIIIDDKTLTIKNLKTVNIHLFYNNIKLYNILFISNFNTNLVFIS